MKTNIPDLIERGRKEFHPKGHIEESNRGVEFEFYYTTKRFGSRSKVELHITSIVRDWEENVYIRKSWYSGDIGKWRERLREHVRQHLTDLGAGRILILNLLRDFEIKEEHFRDWNKYDRVCI